MCAHSHRVLAWAVVLVAVTVPALSQGVGVVSGRATDEKGEPLAGVVLTLTSPGIIGTMNTTTDARGRYWFPGVPGSHHLSVRAEAPGRVPVEYQGYTARRDGVVTIHFTLRRPGDHTILVLVEDDVPYHRLALEGAISTMPGEVETLQVRDLGADTARVLRERIATRPSAVLALGENSARLARRHIRDIPVVYALVPAPLDADLTTANVCGVPLNGAFDKQIEHLKHVMPEARRIGTVYDPHRMARPVMQLEEAARAAQMELVAAHVHGDQDSDLMVALDRLAAERLDAFFLLLDPRLMDAGRFELIINFVEAGGLVMVVPDQSLAVPEKSFSFVPGFWDLGAYAGTLVRSIVEGAAEPSAIGVAYPDGSQPAQGSARLGRQTPRDVLPPGGVGAQLRLALDE